MSQQIPITLQIKNIDVSTESNNITHSKYWATNVSHLQKIWNAINIFLILTFCYICSSIKRFWFCDSWSCSFFFCIFRGSTQQVPHVVSVSSPNTLNLVRQSFQLRSILPYLCTPYLVQTFYGKQDFTNHAIVFRCF